MSQYDIYEDIAKRMDNNIYIGVIGPVRTGKSTFIKRFMELMVLPNIKDENTRIRTMDEMPQSASGKTIMTTEPKFIPDKPVNITLGNNINLNVRMIDCVGYVVPEAKGYMNEEGPRMVNTPWDNEPMPFEEAAEIGTKRVINEHSAIGIVITTDGSITDIKRESYIDTERRVINELKEINKPFIVILNSLYPYSEETQRLKNEMENEYGVSVITLNCAQLKENDIIEIMETILGEFPVQEICIEFPKWIDTLDFNHNVKKELKDILLKILEKAEKVKDIAQGINEFNGSEITKSSYIKNIDMGTGRCDAEILLDEKLFYNILSEMTGENIDDDCDLINILKEFSSVKKGYGKIESALNETQSKGYGIVFPDKCEIMIDEPKIYKNGNQYGVKLKAKGSAVHLIRTEVNSEVSPVIGSEEQAKEYINQIKEDIKSSPQEVMDINIFGRTLDSLFTEGINSKLYSMPNDAQNKLQKTVEKIVNEGSGGLICILL